MSEVKGEVGLSGREGERGPQVTLASQPHTHAANDDAVLQAQRLPQHPELLGDLVGQLSVGDRKQLHQWVPVPISHPLYFLQVPPGFHFPNVDVSASKIQAHI